MTDEAAVLLRIGIFGFVVAVVYWFISYEPLGTLGFLVLGAGPAFAGAYLVRHQPWQLESRWAAFRRLAGIPDLDPDVRAELAAEDLGVLPQLTVWPFFLGLGVTTAITGLVFGFWPLIVGVGMAATGAVGWQSAVNREQRQRQLASPPVAAAPREDRRLGARRPH
jgi:Cytochrome c oxidase subunit IV